ncbi:MAG: DUF11 domain-containing protein, partial [Chloroflexi bacterium]|nr:DUF11 domain-containing protein [Chloroflexota bacterium]
TLRYTVIIRNTGDREATNLTYVDTPDANTSLVNGSVTTTRGVVTSGNASGDLTVGVAIGSVWPGEVVTITYDVVIHVPFPEDVSSVVNHGLVTGDNVPPTPTDDPTTPSDRDPTIVPVNLAPEIIATKTVTLYQDVDASGTTTPGDVLEYTVHITNVGTATAYGVVFQDLLDPNTTLVAGSVYTSQGNVAVGNGPRDEYVIIEVGNLAPYGGAVEIRYHVCINSPLPPGVTIISNQGFINGSNVDSTVTDDPTTPEPDDPTDVVVSPPTYVGLLYMRAIYLNGRQVLIRWETAIEVDNLLFRVYRAPTANWNDATLLVEVPSQAQAGHGAFYAYVDDIPDAGPWWYWLEDVNTTGGTVLHGPVEAFQGAFRYHLPIVMR